MQNMQSNNSQARGKKSAKPKAESTDKNAEKIEIVDIKRSDRVVKRNAIIEWLSALDKTELQIVMACISTIPTIGTIDRDQVRSIQILDICKIYSIHPKTIYRFLENIENRIDRKKIRIRDLDSGHIRHWHWFQGIDYLPGDGRIEFAFSNILLRYLEDIKGDFIDYPLECCAGLKTAPTWLLFENLRMELGKSRRKKTIVRYDIETLRYLLGMENKYTRFGNFKSKVIIPAIDNINRCTDIEIRMSPIKNGVIANSLEFGVWWRMKATDIVPEEIRPLLQKLKRNGVSPARIRKWREMSQFIQMASTIELAIDEILSRHQKKNSIRNLSALLSKTVADMLKEYRNPALHVLAEEAEGDVAALKKLNDQKKIIQDL